LSDQLRLNLTKIHHVFHVNDYTDFTLHEILKHSQCHMRHYFKVISSLKYISDQPVTKFSCKVVSILLQVASLHHFRGNAIPAGHLSDCDEILCS